MRKGKRGSDSQCDPASEIVPDALESTLLSHIMESNEGFALLDTSGRILFINTALSALLGHTGKKVLGTSIMDYISREKSSNPGTFLSTVLETGKTDEVIWFTGTDESVFSSILHGEKVTEETSGASLIALSVRNLDVVLGSTRENDHVHGLMQTILDAIPDTIGIQDMEHKVLRYNQAGYDMLGLSPEQVNRDGCALQGVCNNRSLQNRQACNAGEVRTGNGKVAGCQIVSDRVRSLRRTDRRHRAHEGHHRAEANPAGSDGQRTETQEPRRNDE